MTIDIYDVNPGDELTVKIGSPRNPDSWATLTGKVRRDPLGYLELGTITVRYSDGSIAGAVREIVSHTPTKPAEPENIGAAVEDADGQVWVRVAGAWRDTEPRAGDYRPYDEINVVKVLHEGWPA